MYAGGRSPDDTVTLDETLRYLSLGLNRTLVRRAVKHWRHHGKQRRGSYAVDGVLHLLHEAGGVPSDYVNRLAHEVTRFSWRDKPSTVLPRAYTEFPLDVLLMMASEPSMNAEQRYSALVSFMRLQGSKL